MWGRPDRRPHARLRDRPPVADDPSVPAASSGGAILSTGNSSLPLMASDPETPYPTRRIAMRIMYDGGAFFGWQRQPRGRTVQEELEKMLSRLAGNRPVTVVGAGRTDSGVHAHGQ